ncbi:16S rRNA methyltransferase [Stygiolobus caldivivus]|uniref:Ribosomal RNA small subunit methyltransferase Nep1 n=1 Tax=Stygiolobus caldivivus TaxID=2824673 RepID=A0A8D5U4S3_9CREN|nr:16S rRNA methyltransferase [Stygiolobus caldivivus]BCU69252.1 16S rRNA methyltransferase [Stygiolobus caldivivus]
MGKINLILLDSSLELVPKELLSHPSVISNAKKKGKDPKFVLLDKSLHYKAMSRLKDKEKRGRPDIVHLAMLNFLFLEDEIKGDFFLHTIDGKIIRVSNKTRIPKNYNRFTSLMEQLLRYKRVPVNSNEPLMEITDLTLKSLKKKYKLAVLSEGGEKVPIRDICELGDSWLIGVGAFPHGDFSDEVKANADRFLSIGDNVLETYQVICRLSTVCLSLLGLIRV